MARTTRQRSFFEKDIHLVVISLVLLVVGAVYLNKSDGKGDAKDSGMPSQASAMEAPPDGRIAPDFSLTSTDGKMIKLSDYRGKVVVVDFWATWCPPCKAEIPDFIKLYSQHKDEGLQMIGISLDEGGLKDVKPFMKEYGINYPIVMGTEEVVSAYGGIRGIPTTFVIDKTGHVRGAFEGYRSASVFTKLIQQLIKEN